MGSSSIISKQCAFRCDQATERKALLTEGGRFRVVTKTVKARRVNVGILPCVKITSLRLNANLEEHVASDMLRL